MSVFGIPNVGSTCWLSSLLQLFLSSDRFVLLLESKLSEKKNAPFTQALCNLPQSISILSSLLRPKFYDYGQQDACEGLLFLLDSLHDEHAIDYRTAHPNEIEEQMLAFTHQKVSLIFILFQGIFEWVDSDKKKRYEPFYTLFVEIPNQLRNQSSLKLDALIYHTLTKQRIITMPPILIFSIPRIEYNTEYQLCSQFTLEYPSKKIRYLLKGIVLHAGSQMFGHYTALRKHQNRWYLCDDHNITPLDDLPERIRQVPRLLLFELEGN